MSYQVNIMMSSKINIYGQEREGAMRTGHPLTYRCLEGFLADLPCTGNATNEGLFWYMLYSQAWLNYGLWGSNNHIKCLIK